MRGLNERGQSLGIGVDLDGGQHSPKTSPDRVSWRVFSGSRNSGCSAMALYAVEVLRHDMVEGEDDRQRKEKDKQTRPV